MAPAKEKMLRVLMFWAKARTPSSSKLHLSLTPNVAKLKRNSIIFIHGLRGHPFNTWSVGAVCWPRDFLSQHIENARIITWGYDASFVNATRLAGQDTIAGHAKSLLGDLSFLREDKVKLSLKVNTRISDHSRRCELSSSLDTALVDLWSSRWVWCFSKSTVFTANGIFTGIYL